MGFIRKILVYIIKLLGYDVVRKKYIKFKGWGLISNTNPPWQGSLKNKTAHGYIDIEKKLINRIKEKNFSVTQFDYKINSIGDIINILNDLRYRHYYVYYSALKAFENTKSRNIVECGTCDGLTVYFCMNVFANDKKSKFYLYDSWEAMREKELVSNLERRNIGMYNHLDINNTKKNLDEFDNVIFNKGFIPESLEISTNPKSISWLHIDLNASMPTLESLKFFYPKIEKNGVMLFDDYGSVGYEDTRDVIENFFIDKDVEFLHLPTGQAIVIKKLETLTQ